MSKYATKSPCMKKKLKMGWISNIIAGLVDSWLGESLLGSWGQHIADGNFSVNYRSNYFRNCCFSCFWNLEKKTQIKKKHKKKNNS